MFRKPNLNTNPLVMKILLFVFALVTFSSCLKDNNNADPCVYDACATVAPAAEVQEVENYLTLKGITAIKHCSGVYYVIDNPGTGKNPNICSAIVARYTGQLTSGSVFDQGELPRPYQLGELIKGWVNTLPLIKQGGKIRLFIPPSLGYGNRTTGSIPANSILIFDIELTFVQ